MFHMNVFTEYCKSTVLPINTYNCRTAISCHIISCWLPRGRSACIISLWIVRSKRWPTLKDLIGTKTRITFEHRSWQQHLLICPGPTQGALHEGRVPIFCGSPDYHRSFKLWLSERIEESCIVNWMCTLGRMPRKEAMSLSYLVYQLYTYKLAMLIRVEDVRTILTIL
jgi:hypothetical protein